MRRPTARSRATTLLILLLAANLAAYGCAGLVEEHVEFDLYHSPTSKFAKMEFLGVPKTAKLGTQYTDYLVALIRKCRQYKKTNRLNKVFRLVKGAPEKVVKSLNAQSEAYQDSRYVHGLMVVGMIKQKIERDKDQTDLVYVNDMLDHRWFDSYGNAAHPNHPIYGSEEIGPVMKTKVKRVVQRVIRAEYGVRYALFNKRQSAMVTDKTSYISAQLTTYSKRPVIREANLKEYLLKHLMGRIARAACPKIGPVERVLYAKGSDSKADILLENGLEHIGDENWEKAADSFRRSILIDKKNPLGYHNLGVYYEWAGDIPRAMEEFEKSKRQRKIPDFPHDQYDRSLDLLRPKFNPEELEPKVYGVSGANWVSLLGGKPGSLKVGRTYSVFRTKRLYGDKIRVDGMEIKEVGRVRIIKEDPPFILGRVTQHINPGRVETGDVILVK